MSDSNNETTPLLRNQYPNDDNDRSHTRLKSQNDHEALPALQISILCAAAIAEPLAYFSIFPFISAMIVHTSPTTPESDVGFWAGAIESFFSIIQMALMLPYSHLSNRYGRKPVLVFSLAGTCVFSTLFGLSSTIWQMVLLRGLAGSFAGSVVTVRTMIGESCTKATAGRAYGWFMVARNLGILSGMLIGGGFADPARRFPDDIGDSAFFLEYPYFLSTLVTGGACLLATLLVFFLAEETFVHQKDSHAELDGSNLTTWQLLKAPGVLVILYVFGHTMFLALAHTAILPVFLFTSIPSGGLGFSPTAISYFLGTLAATQALWMLIPFPPLQRRFGTANLTRVCNTLWLVFFATFPALNEVLRADITVAAWIIGVISMIVGGAVAMSFACVQLLVNDIVPSPSELAVINGLALTVNSAVRAITPAIFDSILAASVRTQIIGGHFTWLVLILLTLPLIWVLFVHIPKAVERKRS